VALHRLSVAEQFGLCLFVLAVDGAALAIAWLAGWPWMLAYGRLTLIPPTLLAAAAWYAYRSRRRRT
jgi:membrane protein implicated in regulation of membrane protease activity